MNLHGIAKGAVSSVNPVIQLFIQRSTGYATGLDGKRAPTYAPPQPVFGQVQALTYRDIMQTQGLNLQGTRRAIYLEGNWDGLVRTAQKGGDLITFPDGSVWLIALALETWPDWCKVVATLQDGS